MADRPLHTPTQHGTNQEKVVNMSDQFNPSTEEFDLADTAYVTIDELDGRLILVYATDKGEAQSTTPGESKKYTYIVADVVVLDGAPTEKIPSVPHVIEAMRFSASMPVNQLMPKLKTGRPTLARVTSQPSRFNKNNKAYALGKPETAKDLEKGRAGAALYRDRQAEADPFAA